MPILTLYAKFELKIRLFEKMVTTVARLMQQDEEGVEPVIFDSLATVTSDIYSTLTQDRSNVSHSIKLSVSLPLVHVRCLPGLKALLQVKTSPHHTRLMVCRLIEDMELWQQRHFADASNEYHIEQLSDVNKPFLAAILGSTSNTAELDSLTSKLALFSELQSSIPLSESSGTDSTYRISKPWNLSEGAQIFEAMPATSLDALLDLALTCVSQNASKDTFIQHLKWVRQATCLWSELDQLLLIPRLVELSRILVTQHRSESDVTQLYEKDIPAVFDALTEGIPDRNMWSVGAASKEIEILCVALERDLDVQLALEAIHKFIKDLRSFVPIAPPSDKKTSAAPSSMSSLRRSFGRSNSSTLSSSSNSSSSSNNPTQLSETYAKQLEARDALMRRAFDYAIAGVNSYRPEPFLSTCFDAILAFMSLSFGEELKLDHNLLNRALLLATLFVQTKSDPNSLVTFFREHMVESFSTIINWTEDSVSTATSPSTSPSVPLAKLCVDILEFGYHCVKAGNTNRYKFFCWFMPPIYKQVDSLELTNAGKREITAEIVTTCLATLQKGNDIDLLLRDGVPMVLQLFQTQPTQITPVLRTVSTKLLQHNNFWNLLTLNFALGLAREHYHSFASLDAIDNFFRYLISKGQRKMIIAANEVCGTALTKPQFFGIRNYLFASFEPDLEAFQSRPSEIKERADDKPVERYNVALENRLSMDSVADLLSLLSTVMAMDQKHMGVMKIVGRLLEDVRITLEQRRFDSATINAFRDHLSRVLLFKNLFPTLLNEHAETYTPEQLAKVFHDTFPLDIIRDEETMATLSLLGTRIDHVTNQLPKFAHVAQTTTQILNQFFQWTPPENLSHVPIPEDASNFSPEQKMELARRIYYRKQHLNEHVYNLPQNAALRAHLESMGYHPDFFSRNLEIRVDVDDRRNLDDDFKTSIAALYGEYLDIIKDLYPSIKHITYEGADVPFEDYFVENHRTSFTIEDLRARRNHAIKMIEKRLKQHPNHVNLHNRKLSILTREEGLEETLEKDKLAEGLAPPQRRRYWVRLNNSFWKIAACCGKQISGCYAPNGDHAEKGLENALKANVCFLSLYENVPGKGKKESAPAKKKKKRNKKKKKVEVQEKASMEPNEMEDDEPEEDTPGLEIENMEVIFTDQGLYVFKLYSNGHHLDTTLAWLQFFKILASSRLVPAIIIPNNFPNSRIFGQLENWVPTQVSGSIANHKDNFFEEFGVTSYYDIPVEKIKLGDIILDEENAQAINIADNVDVFNGDLRLSGSRSRLAGSTHFSDIVVTDKEHANMQAKKLRVRPKQDLNGRILTSALKTAKKNIEADPTLAPFLYTIEAFVRHISQYLNLYLESGVRDISLIAVGIDLESWNRRKQVKANQGQLSEEIKALLVQRIADTIHEELEQWFNPQTLCLLFVESRAQFFELRSHWNALAQSQYLDPKDSDKNNADASKDSGEIRPSDVEKAKRGLKMARSLMSEVQTTLSFDKLARVPLEQTIRWIFGNEDRVWRERGGRPGEETLSVFLNFCRAYESDPKQLTQAQQQVRLSTQAQQERDAAAAARANATATNAGPVQSASIDPHQPAPAPSSSQGTQSPVSTLSDSNNNDKEEEETESLSAFRGDHHGNKPWGGFVVMGSIPDPHENDPNSAMVSEVLKSGSGASNREIVAYSIGDYIAPDDFEVITAWVHPNYRSFGLALDLYKKTAYRVWATGGRFVTFDMLLGSVELLTRTSPALYLLDRLGILKYIIVKRKNSHSSETAHGTERFERLTLSLKWMVLAFRILDLWKRFKAWLDRLTHSSSQLLDFPWRSWYQTFRQGDVIEGSSQAVSTK